MFFRIQYCFNYQLGRVRGNFRPSTGPSAAVSYCPTQFNLDASTWLMMIYYMSVSAWHALTTLAQVMGHSYFYLFAPGLFRLVHWFWENVAPKIHKQWMSHFSKASRLTIRHTTSGRNDAVPPQVPYSKLFKYMGLWFVSIYIYNIIFLYIYIYSHILKQTEPH